MQSWKNILRWLLPAVTLPVYYWLAYQTDRTEFGTLLLAWSMVFLLFIYFYQQKEIYGEKLLFASGILFRLVFLFSLPALSNDFFRFVWDGRLIINGLNPFLHLPRDIINQPVGILIDPGWELFEGMGHLQPENYSCYPAFNQFLFGLASLIFPHSIIGNVVMLRLIIVLFDVATFFFIKKILTRLGMNKRLAFLYFLNPLTIIELTGNLHFEGVMIFFLAASLYCLIKTRYTLSALLLAFSVSVKLIPLIFLPLFFRKLGWKKSVIYYLTVFIVTGLLFLPFIDQGLISNIFSSLDLYFRSFEFNASIYYIVREIGYAVKGWNIIATAGPAMAVLVFLSVVSLAIFRKNENNKALITSMLFAVAIYYFLSTTVMPWYVLTLLFLSVFTPYRFVLLWSFTLILSYKTYSNPVWQENLWLNIIEYVPVYLLMFWELYTRRTKTEMAPG